MPQRLFGSSCKSRASTALVIIVVNSRGHKRDRCDGFDGRRFLNDRARDATREPCRQRFRGEDGAGMGNRALSFLGWR